MADSGEKHLGKDTAHKKQVMTAEKAVIILKKNGMNVDEKQAKQILELLFILAKLEVDQYLNS